MTPRQVMRYLELAPAVMALQNFRLAEIAQLPYQDKRGYAATMARWRAQAGMSATPNLPEDPVAKQRVWDTAWARLRGMVGSKAAPRG